MFHRYIIHIKQSFIHSFIHLKVPSKISQIHSESTVYCTDRIQYVIYQVQQVDTGMYIIYLNSPDNSNGEYNKGL